jgi:hypothetical protein
VGATRDGLTYATKSHAAVEEPRTRGNMAAWKVEHDSMRHPLHLERGEQVPMSFSKELGAPHERMEPTTAAATHSVADSSGARRWPRGHPSWRAARPRDPRLRAV